MKVYILHECIDSSDFYAEGNVVLVTKDRMQALSKMIDLYNECKEAEAPVSYNETWCENWEAAVVCSGDNYFRHNWKIDEFEV